jgi:hypothetical protein
MDRGDIRVWAQPALQLVLLYLAKDRVQGIDRDPVLGGFQVVRQVDHRNHGICPRAEEEGDRKPLRAGGGILLKIDYGLRGLTLTSVTSSGVTIWLARRRDKGRPAQHWQRIWIGAVWSQPVALAASALAAIAFATDAEIVPSADLGRGGRPDRQQRSWLGNRPMLPPRRFRPEVIGCAGRGRDRKDHPPFMP